MDIILTHPAKHKCQVWNRLLERCQKLSTFCSRLNSIASEIEETNKDQQSNYYIFEKELSNTDASSKFKGEIFEIFSEMLIKLSPIDNRIGVDKYQVVTEGDTGVDGWGVDRQGRPVAVQIKYRMWDAEINHVNAHLNNFRITAYNEFNVNPEWENNLLIITTGKQVHWRTLERQFNGRVRCINNNSSYRCLKGSQNKTIGNLFSLKTIVDDNLSFWNRLKESLLYEEKSKK